MKRIAGIFNFDRMPVAVDEIQRMTGVMELQGSDLQDIWIDGEVGLGCTCTGNVPGEHIDCFLSHPLNEQCVITFDGRIDNRQELTVSLKPYLAASRPPISDEELVLAAYEKWGLECPRHLIGDFAFAIWDSANHSLVCVRDHFGVKPFYYSFSNGSFVFASTPRALLASWKVPAVFYEERIADLLVEFGGRGLEAVDKTSSFYKDVYRLPPAHMLVIQPSGWTEQRYWQLSPTVPSTTMTETDYVELFQELFREAVRCRFPISSAQASMLSGGLDSSAIVGMGRKILMDEGKESLQIFAALSSYAGKNRETANILAVINQGGLQPHLVSEIVLIQRMDDLITFLETEAEPFDCLMNLHRMIYLLALEQGLSAILDGADGDILLLGSSSLIPLWRSGDFRAIFYETLQADGLTAEYKRGKLLFFNSCLSAFTPVAPDWLRKIRQPFRYHMATQSAVDHTIIDREFASNVLLGDRISSLDSYKSRSASYSMVESHKSALNHPNIPAGLERYERVASAFGIEARHPLLDIRLAKFCLGLPWQLKTYHGWTKMILRRAVEPLLPAEVVWRSDKDHLGWVFNSMILKERAAYFCQITTDERANLKPYVDLGKLMKFWDDYLTRGDETHAELLWSGIALAMWLRQQRKIMKESQK